MKHIYQQLADENGFDDANLLEHVLQYVMDDPLELAMSAREAIVKSLVTWSFSPNEIDVNLNKEDLARINVLEYFAETLYNLHKSKMRKSIIN